jgi:LmbE family N-acetylglucosaminyl deacetylase
MRAGFDHLAPGTPERAWATSRLGEVPPLRLPDCAERLLVLAAHPDDETLGAGGLIHTASRLGTAVDVLVASDGAASHPRSSTHSPQRLARLRRAEAEQAIAELAPAARVRFLGLPDGSLTGQHRTLITEVRSLLGSGSWLVAPWIGDRHPDHEACGQAALALGGEALACWQYPIWAWHWAEPDGASLPWPQLRRMDLDAAAGAAKHRAIRCYASQHRPLSELPGDEAILPAHVVAHFRRPYEIFIGSAPDGAADPGYFDALYAGADDPWGLQDRFYEVRKRELILAALPHPRYRRAFEPGCALGSLSAALAARCDELIAWDLAPRAIEQARARVGGYRGVHVARGQVPRQWPDGEFDLIVLSEIGYYCRDLAELRARVEQSLTADGTVVACHWRHPAPDHPHSARAVHDAIGAHLRPVVRHVEEDFWLDVWTRSGRSVARRTGLLG